jgi:hypothetical protein
MGLDIQTLEKTFRALKESYTSPEEVVASAAYELLVYEALSY